MKRAWVVAALAALLVAGGCSSGNVLPATKATATPIETASALMASDMPGAKVTPTPSPSASPSETVAPGIRLQHILNAGKTVDLDGDGVPNAKDNCSGVANPTQADSDGNGLGDVCDPGDVSLPWVKIVFPRSDYTYRGGAPIEIDVSAACAAPIARVEFYDRGTKIGEAVGRGVKAGRHVLEWGEPQDGQHVLTAVVTDENGAAATTAPVKIRTITVITPSSSPKE